MALSVETFVPELDVWVEEARMKPGQKPTHIKQNYNPDGRRPFYFQCRALPRSAMIEIVDFVDVLDVTKDREFALVKKEVAEEPEIFANLTKGHDRVTQMIQTDHDTRPHLYRFRFE